jgi:sugar phosphate isomerase/epimerase
MNSVSADDRWQKPHANNGAEPSRPPTIALSAHWYTFPERFDWIAKHGFALEYAPNPEALESLPEHVDPLLDAGVPVRYHGFFPDYEIGHPDASIASGAMQVHRAALEAIQGRGEPVITLHVGLRRKIPVDPARAVESLSLLVRYGRELGLTICLENLRKGPTSDPQTLVNWAAESGAMITLDVGHMVSCAAVESGQLTSLAFLEMVTDRLFEVHMYEREADRHYPPRSMAILGPIVDRLLRTRCSWWTIELEDPAEALATRGLLLDHLQARGI